MFIKSKGSLLLNVNFENIYFYFVNLKYSKMGPSLRDKHSHVLQPTHADLDKSVSSPKHQY